MAENRLATSRRGLLALLGAAPIAAPALAREVTDDAIRQVLAAGGKVAPPRNAYEAVPSVSADSSSWLEYTKKRFKRMVAGKFDEFDLDQAREYAAAQPMPPHIACLASVSLAQRIRMANEYHMNVWRKREIARVRRNLFEHAIGEMGNDFDL